MESIDFTINGRPMTLARSTVELAMRGVSPEPVQSHAVEVGGVLFPVKQAFAKSTGLDRLDFTSAVARRQLDRLGFPLFRLGPQR